MDHVNANLVKLISKMTLFSRLDVIKRISIVSIAVNRIFDDSIISISFNDQCVIISHRFAGTKGVQFS